MSEINKIVKFTVIADQIAKSPEVIDLKEDDVVVVQLQRGTTREEMDLFNQTFNEITNFKHKVMVTFNPVEVFGYTLEELEKITKYVKTLKEEEEN